MRLSLGDSAKRCGARAGFEPAVRSNIAFECRTGDSRAYSRPAPASRGPGYTTRARARSLYPGQSRYAKVTKLNFHEFLRRCIFRQFPPPAFCCQFSSSQINKSIEKLKTQFCESVSDRWN